MADTHPLIVEIDDEQALFVGKIITLWSYEEWLLRDTTYRAMHIGPKHGRLAVREPRAQEYPTLIKNLLLANNRVLTYQYRALSKAIERAADVRNMFGHSVWVRTRGGSISLQVTASSWPDGTPMEKIPKKIIPEGRPITKEYLEGSVATIKKAIAMTEEFRGLIIELLEELPARYP